MSGASDGGSPRLFDAQPFGALAAKIAGAKFDRRTRARLGRGDSPRTGQPVWRNSYYENTIEHRIWRPFGDGTKRNGARLAAALLKSARSLDRRTRAERRKDQPGTRNGVLGDVAIEVLEALLDLVDYMTGRLEPAIATLAEMTQHSYSAVHAALRRLRAHGFLHWVRRSRKLDNDGAGPQVEQISNAYVLLIPKALDGLKAIIFGKSPLPDDDVWRRTARKQQIEEMLSSLSPAEFLRATWTGDPLAGETLKRIASLKAVEWADSANPRAREKPGDHTDP